MTVLLGNFPRSFSLPRAPNLKHSPFAHFQILGNHQAESAEIGNIIECCEGNQVDRAVAAQLQDCRFASHHIVPIHFARGGSYSLRVWISATHNPTQGVAHARKQTFALEQGRTKSVPTHEAKLREIRPFWQASRASSGTHGNEAT
jgi:hypothetical protein